MTLENLKSDVGHFLGRLLERDLIHGAAYDLLYEDEMAAIDAAYKIGKNENSKNQKGVVNENKNKTI